MERLLPPIEGVKPHVTSPFLATNRPEGSSNPHRGTDFNYLGGRDAPLNRSYQTVHSPVDGVVENAGAGTVGRISIRDGNGYRHEILHTHSQQVAVGDRVVAGQPIGTMGNMGVKKAGVESGDHHVHYQLLDPSTGFRLRPSGFADDQDPSLRASREANWRYLQSKDANIEQAVDEEPGPATPPDATPETRYLGRRIAGQPEPIAPDAPASFDDRFGNWNLSAGPAPRSVAASSCRRNRAGRAGSSVTIRCRHIRSRRQSGVSRIHPKRPAPRVGRWRAAALPTGAGIEGAADQSGQQARLRRDHFLAFCCA